MNKLISFLNISNHPASARKEFLFNLLLGVATLIIFIAVKDTTIMQAAINGWFDYYIMFRMDAETDTQTAAKNISFLDFDNKSFQALNKPDLTPRDKIAELLSVAYRGNARIVILDFDFAEPDYSPARKLFDGEIAKSGSERDRELFDAIERVKNDSASQTKILLPLTNYADKTIKRNVFSSLIDNEKIFGVTPTLTTNRIGDNYARFWLPYIEVKDAETDERKILWSIPLLTAVLYSGNVAGLEKLQDDILHSDKNFFVTSLHRETTEQFKFYRERTADGGLLRDTSSLQYNRIQYAAVPPDVLTQFPFGTIEPANIAHWRKDGLDNKRIDCNDKIVIIGRADDDSADFFLTPCGDLTGMYVHGNSIASILGETRPHLAPLYKYVLIELLLILIAAYSFLGLSEFKAKVVIFVLTPLCWILNYVYFCFTNEFVYLSFAFTVVGIYNFVNNVQAFILRLRGISSINFLRRNRL